MRKICNSNELKVDCPSVRSRVFYFLWESMISTKNKTCSQRIRIKDKIEDMIDQAHR